VILYLDTSSLVKLYLDEAHSQPVRDWAREAEFVATCRVALPEAMSAFTRRRNSGTFSEVGYQRSVDLLSRDWPLYTALEFDEEQAAELVRRHGLRGLAAIHLSSAKLLLAVQEGQRVFFSSFDDELLMAAREEGVPVLAP
jgi:predicted nucleic acid-binding protein